MDITSNVSAYDALIILVAGSICYAIAQSAYRLFLHPLAKFPGPKLAAASQWYEFYYDVVVAPGGQYSKRVAAMHKRYGPIVRVNPNELHISDSSYYDTLYSGKRDKWPAAAAMAGLESGSFATVPHELHRKRRAANLSLLAKRAVVDAVPMIQARIKKLCAAFARAAERGAPLELSVTFLAFTTDTMGYFLLNEDLGMQDQAAEAAKWQAGTHQMARATPLIKQFPWLVKPGLMIPQFVWEALAPEVGCMVGVQFKIRDSAERFLSSQAQKNGAVVDGKEAERPASIFHAIYAHPAPLEEKSLGRLWHEAASSIIAGSETTGRVITRATYEMQMDREVLGKVRKSIDEAMSASGRSVAELTLAELERLPWLVATVKESLRISANITSRLPLCSREPLKFHDWTIPAGTPTSMTPCDVLYDSNIFPDPEAFRPQRWLTIAEDGSLSVNNHLDRYLVSFGKGPRMCQGTNLANAELFLAIAAIMTQFDLELYDVVKERDIDFVADCFLGEVRADTKGVRATVKKLVPSKA